MTTEKHNPLPASSLQANDMVREHTGYFSRWAERRALYRRIVDTLNAGGTVTVATYTRATHYKPQHINMFSVKPSGVYVQAGKRRDCIDLCAIRFNGKR